MAGKPSPNITWYKDGIDLKIDQMEFKLENFQREDAGDYKCEVCNRNGCIKRTYSILAKGKMLCEYASSSYFISK